MANTHPYISGPGNVAQMITQLRKSFPGTISSETVKKLGLAPNNESHVINVLQFIGVIDSEGKKTSAAAKVFSHHKDDEFAKSFSDLVGNAYSTLFELHGPGAWDLSTDELITFFRQSDQTSEAIGRRQAGTFKVLAGLAGHGEIPEPRTVKMFKYYVNSFISTQIPDLQCLHLHFIKMPDAFVHSNIFSPVHNIQSNFGSVSILLKDKDTSRYATQNGQAALT